MKQLYKPRTLTQRRVHEYVRDTLYLPHYAAERLHCLTTGRHFTKKVRRGNYTACWYCGGVK